MQSMSKTSIILASVAALVIVMALFYLIGGPAPINVALGRAVTASASFESSAPASVVDGDISTSWISGTFPPAWVEIDLGAVNRIDLIKLIVEQTPPGPSSHTISVAVEAGSFTPLEVISGDTDAGQELSVAPSSALRDARFVRVETTSSPSWVAWREIEVWGVPR